MALNELERRGTHKQSMEVLDHTSHRPFSCVAIVHSNLLEAYQRMAAVLYDVAVQHSSDNILEDSGHPLNHLFQLLPFFSRAKVQSILC